MTHGTPSRLELIEDPMPAAAEPQMVRQTLPPARRAPDPVQQIHHLSQMQRVMTAIASLLAVRILLLLAVIFSFVLGMMAMHRQTWTGLAILASFCALVLIPLVYLERNARLNGGA